MERICQINCFLFLPIATNIFNRLALATCNFNFMILNKQIDEMETFSMFKLNIRFHRIFAITEKFIGIVEHVHYLVHITYYFHFLLSLFFQHGCVIGSCICNKNQHWRLYKCVLYVYACVYECVRVFTFTIA